MEIDEVKKVISLVMTAFGIFVVIFLIFSVYFVSRFAQKKQDVKKGWANEKISRFPTLTILPTK